MVTFFAKHQLGIIICCSDPQLYFAIHIITSFRARYFLRRRLRRLERRLAGRAQLLGLDLVLDGLRLHLLLHVVRVQLVVQALGQHHLG